MNIKRKESLKKWWKENKNSEKVNRRNAKISLSLKGRKLSEDDKKKLSTIHKNRFSNLIIRKKYEKYWENKKGRKISAETKLKMSKSHIGKIAGDKNPMKLFKTRKHLSATLQNLPISKWTEFKKFEDYPREFHNIKEKIRKRDNYRCQECFRHQSELRNKKNKQVKLDIHHIDFNKKNNNPLNLLSLCRTCHSQTYFNRDKWINYYQNKIVEGILG